jgi:CRP-like cAMP-binding protein
MWSKEHVEELFAALPAFKDYSDKLIYNNLQASRDRIRMNISYTAEEKYQEFMQSFPDVFNRVPLHMVASYLGVSRETLTRIRKKLWRVEQR